jgi:hypothetical protein
MALTTINTKTLPFTPLRTDQKITLPIFDATMTAVTFYLPYSNTTTAHFNSFAEISTRLESYLR